MGDSPVGDSPSGQFAGGLFAGGPFAGGPFADGPFAGDPFAVSPVGFSPVGHSPVGHSPRTVSNDAIARRHIHCDKAINISLVKNHRQKAAVRASNTLEAGYPNCYVGCYVDRDSVLTGSRLDAISLVIVGRVLTT